jgi:serine phosphatase RsbU (regulator of sigma subunit)
MTVLDLLDEETPRLGYAVTAPGGGARFMVYAEAALPVDKTAVVQPDSAFEDLDYSLHLGPEASPEALIFASTSELPLDGRSAREAIPFGDTELLLTMAPTEQLGGSLNAALPAIVLATGVPATVAAGALTETLQRRRRHAERLAADNEQLLGEQRTSFAAFQRSLLPRGIPAVAEVEVEVRYVAGDVGTYVGGDWYDLIDTSGSIVVVVGDVSGRGLAAASAMAAMRHTVATLASMGLSPDEVLTRAAQLAVRAEDGHFATVVVGALDKVGRTFTVASAGHPPPLVAAAGDARWMELVVGPPICFGPPGSYRSSTTAIPDDAAVLLVTDGLYERRGETVDEGMDRLRRLAGATLRTSDALGPSVDRLIGEMTGGAASDDTAAVAIRWRT